MAKDPAFLFYPGDWLGGTITFNRHQKGCYIDLLMAQFNSGPLSIDEIKDVLGDDFTLWDRKLKDKFKVDEAGKFFNKRLFDEQSKRKNFSESRRKNLKDKDDIINHTSTHMVPHMEIEIENKIEVVIKSLNEIIKAGFRNSKSNSKFIAARFAEGFTLEDFKSVINYKTKEWGADDKMKQYLRPETLFGNKFEGYLQASKNNNGGKNRQNTEFKSGGFGKL